ncbi:MAG: ATP-binding protein [Gemmatimonadota bacterium]
MNLNRLFPRLSIRAKLVIAFTLLATVPLAAVAGYAVRHSAQRLRGFAMATLEHDLAMARSRTESSIREVQRDVAYLAQEALSPLLTESGAHDWERAAASVERILTFRPELYQVKVIDGYGNVLLVAPRPSEEPNPGASDEVGGLYYLYRARRLEPGEDLLLPVELRGPPGGGLDRMSTVPALAVVVAVRGPDGGIRGIVVGEALASAIFAGIEMGSQTLEGVTGLVDPDGFYLYHSALKRNWANLLAAREEINLHTQIPSRVAAGILAGRSAGTTTLPDRRIMSFMPVRLTDSNAPPLMLYRTVPLSALNAGARRFLRAVAGGGLLVLALVLALAIVAAHQFTQPIYQLRQGARRLAQGGSEGPLDIATNDELEDLAADFSSMARALGEQRRKLEELVEERTRALRETHAELAGILEHSADAIIGLDPDHKIRIWNWGAEWLFGYGPEEAVGHNVDDLILPWGERWKDEAAFIRRELAGRGAVVNLRTRRKGKEGEPFPVSLTETTIREAGGLPLGYSLIIRDVRMQAKLEEHMRRSERIAALSVMAAGLAHELRNPLAVITNRLECMEREARTRCDECVLTTDLTVLREHTARLAQVTQDLLKFGEEEDERYGDVVLPEVVSGVVGLLQRTYKNRNVSISTRFAPELPTLTGNAKVLETVVMNLVLNAIEVTPAGGKVTVEAETADADRAVRLRVIDHGPGIPRPLRQRIFEPFFTTKSPGRGTGLGLAVCRSIIEKQGGEIWVESEEGRGSRFIVSLPLDPASDRWREHVYS